MKGWKWMQGLATSLGIASLLAGCTPEELIAVRDAGNPNDPSIAERPIEPLVASRMHGSNFRQKVVKTGFGANGHSQTWDGRVFIGAVPLGGGEVGWAVQVFRPELVVRDSDGAVDFRRTHPTLNAMTRKSVAVSIDLQSQNDSGMLAGSLNALAITPHPNPSNPSLAENPDFDYDIHKNPFPSDSQGNYLATGAYETYEILLFATDYTVPKRTVTLDVRLVIANPRTPTAVLHSHEILRQAQTLLDTNGNQLVGIEPSVTFDGRLLVVHDGNGARYSFNATPGALTGWSPLRTIADMHWVNAQTDVDGEPFSSRYPIARKPLLDFSGAPYQQGDTVWGSYPWISLDGTDMSFQSTLAGIPGTPSFAQRGGFTLVGTTTKYQSIHVDGPVNDSRLGNFAGGTKLFTSSPGMLPGFWFPFIDKVNQDGLPIPYSTVKPVFPFFHSNGGEYFEVPLEDALDGRYLAVLRMTELIKRDRSFDTTVAPDTSGNRAHGNLKAGAAFPIEAGLGDVNLDPGLGRSVLFGGGGYVEINDNAGFDQIDDEFSAELFFMQRDSLDFFNPLVYREGAFFLMLVNSGELLGQVIARRKTKAEALGQTPTSATGPVTTFGGSVQAHVAQRIQRRLSVTSPPVPVTLVPDEYTHFALTAAIGEDNVLRLRIYQDGALLSEKTRDLGLGEFELVENDRPIFVGPRMATAIPANGVSIDDVKLSFVERSQEHIRESAYQHGIVDQTFDVAALTAAELALGEDLFFDVNLSGDGSMSCATCHVPEHNFTDTQVLPISGGARNTPTLLGRAHSTRQLLDGRAASLEEQALMPIFDPLEMNNTEAGLLATLTGDHDYTVAFNSVYGSPATIELAARALANFQRSIATPNTPFDDFKNGNLNALTDSEKRGMQLFFHKARCSACHNGENFADELFHNTGFVDLLTVTELDVGRGGARFKTPTLRGVGLTAPYLHDGSVATLEQIVDLYDQGGLAQGGPDVEMKRLNLTADEKTDLVNFLLVL